MGRVLWDTSRASHRGSHSWVQYGHGYFDCLWHRMPPTPERICLLTAKNSSHNSGGVTPACHLGYSSPNRFSTKAVQYTRWGKETLIQDLVQATLLHITLSQPNEVLLQTFHTWPQFSAGGGEFHVMSWEEDSWKVSSRHLLCTCSFYTLYAFTAVSS